MFENGVRTLLGIGRGGRAKILPILLLIATITPALIFVVALALAGAEDTLPTAGDYYGLVGIILVLFGAIMAPELLIADRRSNVLQLYLVRPLTSTDYVVARFLAFFVVVLALVYSGQVILLAGYLLTVDGPGAYLQDNWLDIPRFLGAGILFALFVTAIPMAAAAVISRRAYVAVFVIAIFLASGLVADGLADAENCESVEVRDETGQLVSVESEVCESVVGGCRPLRFAHQPVPGPREPERHNLRPRGRLSLGGGGGGVEQRVPHWGLRGVHRAAVPVPVAPLPEDDPMTGENAPAVQVNGLSKWYGSVVAVNDVSLEIYPGVTGILGPNGAGKTTLLHMIAGLAAPSEGVVKVLGQAVRGNPQLYRRIGIMSEHDALYPFMTGRDFVALAARLQGIESGEAVDRAVEEVGLTEVKDRKIGGYSRGMRQRIRLAATIVHDPEVLVLDEPLNGADPRQRLHFGELVQEYAAAGRTVLISSHILEEVESLAGQILLMVSGKLAAAGDYRTIREKLDERPFKVRVAASKEREMAAALLSSGLVTSVSLEDGAIDVLTKNISEFQAAVARLAQENGSRLYRVEPLDDSLESVFSYVVQG